MRHQSLVRTKMLVHIAIFVALEVVLNRFLSINTQFVKIGFAWLPMVVCASMYGPLWTGTAWFAADLVGYMVGGAALGAYFPGIGLTNFIGGAVFGMCLYKKPVKKTKIVLSVLVWALLGLTLNSMWLVILYGRSLWAILPMRILQAAIHIPIQIFCIWTFTTEKSAVGRAVSRARA